MSAMPGMFLFVFVAICAAAVGLFVFTIVRAIRMWTANNAQPVRQELAEVVAKRTEVSGGENSTSTARPTDVRLLRQRPCARRGQMHNLRLDLAAGTSGERSSPDVRFEWLENNVDNREQTHAPL